MLQPHDTATDIYCPDEEHQSTSSAGCADMEAGEKWDWSLLLWWGVEDFLSLWHYGIPKGEAPELNRAEVWKNQVFITWYFGRQKWISYLQPFWAHWEREGKRSHKMYLEGEGGKMVKILLPMKESVSQVESVQVKPFMAHSCFGFRIS